MRFLTLYIQCRCLMIALIVPNPAGFTAIFIAAARFSIARHWVGFDLCFVRAVEIDFAKMFNESFRGSIAKWKFCNFHVIVRANRLTRHSWL